MNRYNTYLTDHFRGCKLLAETFDPYRKRQVKLYQIPNYWDVVGVSDGAESWIAPVAGDPLRVNIERILRDIQEGKRVVPVQGTRRARIAIPTSLLQEIKNADAPVARRRTQLELPGVTPAATIRRR